MKRRRLEDGREVFSQIEIEDLQDEESSGGIVLEMTDRQRYFEGGVAGSANNGAAKGQQLDPRTIIWEARNSLGDWESTLSGVRFFYCLPFHRYSERVLQLKIERQAGDFALRSMTHNVAARLDVRSKKSTPSHPHPSFLHTNHSPNQTTSPSASSAK